jgi:hypothetical protein
MLDYIPAIDQLIFSIEDAVAAFVGGEGEGEGVQAVEHLDDC